MTYKGYIFLEKTAIARSSATDSRHRVLYYVQVYGKGSSPIHLTPSCSSKEEAIIKAKNWVDFQPS